jgi:hypothetical protein
MKPTSENAVKQNNTLHLAQEFLRLMGSGAEASDIARLFSGKSGMGNSARALN